MTALPGAACNIPTGRGRGKSDGAIKQVKTAVPGGFVVAISFPVRLFYIEKNLYKVERGISMRRFSRGDLYFANLNPVVGSEQGGCRPVLILQNNIGNWFSSTVIVASVSSRPDKKRRLPTHCYIQTGEGLKQPSVVLLEQLRTLDKCRLQRFIGSLDDECMKEVDQALAVSVGLQDLPLYLHSEKTAEGE